MPDPYPHLTHLIRIPTHQEFLSQQQRRAQIEADTEILLCAGSDRRHEAAHFIDGRWICVCGCGQTWTRKEWKNAGYFH